MTQLHVILLTLNATVRFDLCKDLSMIFIGKFSNLLCESSLHAKLILIEIAIFLISFDVIFKNHKNKKIKFIVLLFFAINIM